MPNADGNDKLPWWARVLTAGLVIAMLGWYLNRLTERVDDLTTALVDLRIAVEGTAQANEKE